MVGAMQEYVTHTGRPVPFGASLQAGGVQFAVFSRHATSLSVLLFDDPEDDEPSCELVLDPRLHKTGDVWHILVEGIGAGQLYLYRADGPYEPLKGHRFNRHKLLLDPYTRAVTGNFEWDMANAYGYDRDSPLTDLSFDTTPNVGRMPKCIVVDDTFDWQGDRPLNKPLRFSIIYETHVRGLTCHPTAAKKYGVKHPGTFRGVVEMIPYLKDLGVTALELLPVQEFDELEVPRINPFTGETLHNYWGYSTLSFFAPKARYSSAGQMGEQVNEFREMVRELHKADIEVILDIVFNHTSEGNELGPTLCFRGLDNDVYYMLAPDRRYYMNFSGTGNTLNCNHPIVRDLVHDCLRYWVVDMHVDGFRFDLGSVLGRDGDGRLLENPPVLERIAEDPVLRHTKIIAEAWDAAGAYQVGWFPGGRWAEWNDRYRDDVRRFWRGDRGTSAQLATRLTGSSDLYLRDGRKPFHSINFVTAHDGFTLNDLVSYERKHNLANGENDRDGHGHNISANYGIEGPTDDPAIEATRNRQVKNFLATLLLSVGTPMLLGGDEMRRTQRGNNNAYCQHNAISWYDWNLEDQHADIHRFCRELIHFRLRHPAFLRPEFYVGGDTTRNAIPDIEWFSPDGSPADFGAHDQTIAYRLDGSKAVVAADRDDNDFFLMFNARTEPQTFFVCAAPFGRRWHLAVNTAAEAPHDLYATGEEPRLNPQDRYTVPPRTMVVLLSKPAEGA